MTERRTETIWEWKEKEMEIITKIGYNRSVLKEIEDKLDTRIVEW